MKFIFSIHFLLKMPFFPHHVVRCHILTLSIYQQTFLSLMTTFLRAFHWTAPLRPRSGSSPSMTHGDTWAGSSQLPLRLPTWKAFQVSTLTNIWRYVEKDLQIRIVYRTTLPPQYRDWRLDGWFKVLEKLKALSLILIHIYFAQVDFKQMTSSSPIFAAVKRVSLPGIIFSFDRNPRGSALHVTAGNLELRSQDKVEELYKKDRVN